MAKLLESLAQDHQSSSMSRAHQPPDILSAGVCLADCSGAMCVF